MVSILLRDGVRRICPKYNELWSYGVVKRVDRVSDSRFTNDVVITRGAP